MVELFGKNYYIDLDAVTEKCRIEDVDFDFDENGDPIEPVGGSVNIFKYEILKMCVDRALGEYETTDDVAFFGADKLPVSFKIAFNTLIKNEILIEESNDE